ncbi:Mss4-like protein [Mycena floridula]|nr:Mss4-like protein [Mycena floridula]
MSTHAGGCFCGSLTYMVTGKPNLSAFCHCTLCQRLNAAAFIHTLHFSAASFSWTSSDFETSHDTFCLTSKPWKKRVRCKTCGTCVASYNSKKDSFSVWGVQLNRDEASGKIKDWEAVRPTEHIFYGTRLVEVDDTLPKWEGYPNLSNRIP